MPDLHTIGLLGGTGPQGRGLALRFAAAGHMVLLGSRDAARAATITADLVAGRDLPIRGVSNFEAAGQAEVVVVTCPYEGHAPLLRDLADDLGGKVVVDVVNPIGWDADGPYALDVPEGSAAEQAAALLGSARVVAAFHHVAPRLLGDLDRLVETDVLVAADDEAAKGLVVGLADQIPGCRGIDAGPLRQARQLEAFTAVIVAVNRRYRIHAGIRVSRLGDDRRRRMTSRPAGALEEGS